MSNIYFLIELSGWYLSSHHFVRTHHVTIRQYLELVSVQLFCISKDEFILQFTEFKFQQVLH